MISTSVIVSFVISAVVGIAGFLLKFMMTRLVDGLKESMGELRSSLGELTSELKEINKKVDVLSQYQAASTVREQRYDEEIKILRLRQHELSNEQAKAQGILERCKNCVKG